MMTNKTLEELEMDKIVAHRASMHRVNNGLVSLEQAIKSACLEYAQAQDAKIAELETKLRLIPEALKQADLVHLELCKLFGNCLPSQMPRFAGEKLAELRGKLSEADRKYARMKFVFDQLNSENSNRTIAMDAPEARLRVDLFNAEQRSTKAWQRITKIGELVNRCVADEIHSEVAKTVQKLTAAESRVKELQTKLTETNERLMARELLLTHQHDDVVKLEGRVKELESIAAFARHRPDCLFYKEMPCNCGLKSAQQPKEHHEGT